MYPVLEQELDTMVSGYQSVNLVFFGIAFGAFIAVAIPYWTVSLGEPLQGRFFSAMLVSAVASVYFAIMATRDWFRSRKVMRQLRRETVDAVIKGD